MSFGDCAVNYESVRTFFAMNKCNYLVEYSFEVEKPFKIHPSSGELPPGQSIQFEVIFCADVFSLILFFFL
jgi:hypothetical protein